MSSISHQLSGQWDLTRPIQYIVEGTTPATFGVTPTASPVGVLAGAIQDLTITPMNETVIKRIIGKREFYKDLIARHKYTFELKFAPLNSTLMKYGSEPANGAGTIAESLSFLRTPKVNNAGTMTESFQFLKGSRMASLDISVAGKEVEVTSNWVCREVTVPVFTANGGLTTPNLRTFADVSGSPWMHTDNAASPITINAVTYPCNKFHVNFNNNLAIDEMNGTDYVDQITQGNRDITGDFTIKVGKDFALETDTKSTPLPARAASYVLKAATSTISFTDLYIHQYTDAMSGDDNNTWEIGYTFVAANASIS